MKMRTLAQLMVGLVLLAAAQAAVAADVTKPATQDKATSSAAELALQRAAKEKQHLFLLVYEKQDEATNKVQQTVTATVKTLGKQAQWLAVERGAATNKALVEKYGLDRAPMPLVFVMAPNGAVTGGVLGEQVTRERLEAAIASPVMQQCLKAMQERKLVLLCVQNGATTQNDAAMQGVNAFKTDSRFAQFTEIVTVNPADKQEQKFLSMLKIINQSGQLWRLDGTDAVTALLAPPNAVIGVFKGATTKDGLVAALAKATSSGCGPSGCGPTGCAPQ